MNLHEDAMIKNFIELYDEIDNLLCENSAKLLNNFREIGRNTLFTYGFPTKKNEEYLQSPFATDGKGNSNILDRDYGINVKRFRFPITPENVFRCAVPGINAHVMFMINDILYSEPNNDMDGAIFCSMKTACEQYGNIVDKYIGKAINNESNKDAFVALNNLFAQDGYFLYVPKGVKVNLPVQIINVMRANMDSMATTRNLIVAEENSEVHMLICDHAADMQHFFANRQTEIFVGDNAEVHYYSVESSHEKMNNISGTYINQSRDSRFIYSTLGLVNGNTRNHVEVNLNGEGAEVTLGGMLISDRKQHTDNHTIINHNVANCKSEELYKYILDEEAHAIFSGMVLVKEGAQQTLAQQTNKNICLTPEAHVYTKPQLVIYADDVQCGHGATTGQLDEKAMFYMQQRGIGKNEARMLLLSAFSADVIALIEIEALRDRLTMMIEKRLRGESARCKSCGINC